jgi:hypothetical protein
MVATAGKKRMTPLKGTNAHEYPMKREGTQCNRVPPITANEERVVAVTDGIQIPTVALHQICLAEGTMRPIFVARIAAGAAAATIPTNTLVLSPMFASLLK